MCGCKEKDCKHAPLARKIKLSISYQLALKSYETALALNPYDFNTRYNLGELYYTGLNDRRNALKEFVRVLEDNPALFNASYKAGLICAANGMTKEARLLYTRVISLDALNPVAKHRLRFLATK